MTQSPLGQNPGGSGPFDERGPGNPDVASTEATPEQPVAQHSGTPLTETDYPGEPYADTPRSSSYPQTGYVGTAPGESSAESTGPSGSGSKVDEAKDKAKEVAGTAKGEAKNVADTAVSSGRQVAATAQDEARNVAAETKQQAASLLDTVRTEVAEQASTQQGRIAEALHSLSKELGSMASSSQESGPLTDLAHQASRKGGEIAHFLQDREPSDVLESVRSYARRRPGTFLVLCGLAGVVAGRLTRSTVANRTSLDTKDDSGARGDRELRSNYAASGYAAGQPTGYVRTEPATAYATAPATQPAELAGERSIGVYGGSVESTEPAGVSQPYGDDPAQPASGYVGSTRPLDEPNGDPTR